MDPNNLLLDKYVDDIDFTDYPTSKPLPEKYRRPQKRDTRHTFRVKVSIQTPNESRLIVTNQKARNKRDIEYDLRTRYSHYSRNEISWTITKVK